MEKQFEKPMGWYKFIIYFQLFAAAVFNVGAGIIFFTGSHYGLDSFELKLFYGVLSNLKTLDICMGIVSIFLAVFAIIVRQKLAHFDEQGPKLYLGYQLITVGVNILYIAIAVIIIYQTLGGTSDDIWSMFASSYANCGMGISMYVANKVYFDNRKEYFVNHGTTDIPGVKNAIPQPPKNEVPVQPFSGSQNVPPVQPQPGEDPHYVPVQPQPQPETKQKHGVLVGLCGLYAGAQIEMKDGEMITFGRADDNNLIFASEPRISRHHCMIRWNAQKQKYIFRDYSSSGSYINGQQDCLPQNLDLEIACGSKIALGNNDNVFLFQ